MSKEVTGKVKQIVESYVGPINDPTEDFSDLDSLDKLDLIMSIEKEFNLAIADSEINKLNNLNKLQTYVINHIK